MFTGHFLIQVFFFNFLFVVLIFFGFHNDHEMILNFKHIFLHGTNDKLTNKATASV